MSQYQEDTHLVTEEEKKVEKPSRYKVIILNDDYTSMEFVVYVLEMVFHKTEQQAFALMMSIHENGSGVAGVFSFEIAEMKTALVMEMARQHDHPLQCIMEEE